MPEVVRVMHTESGLLEELAAGGDPDRGRGSSCWRTSGSTCPTPTRRRWPGTQSLRIGASSRATCLRWTRTCTIGSSTCRSIKELARRWYPRSYYNAPTKHGGHRALGDIIDSIEELQVLPGGHLRGRTRARTPTRHAASPRSTSDQVQPPHQHPTGKRVRRRTRRSRTLADGRAGLRAGHGGCSSAGRAPGCGPGGRGFKSRHSPHAPQGSRTPAAVRLADPQSAVASRTRQDRAVSRQHSVRMAS